MPTRILIAEDETIIAHDMKTSLTQLGYEVTGIARSAEELLEQMTSKPDLILMDIRLRGCMDGIQAARRIRNKTGIPVIYVSGSTDRLTQRRLGSRPVGFIQKPFDICQLHRMILTTLNENKTRKVRIPAIN